MRYLCGMKLLLKRVIKGDTYTVGDLYIDGVHFCDTLEDRDRGLTSDMSLLEIQEKKVAGETAIPTGTYKITMDVVSPRFSKKSFYSFCGGKLPRLKDVKGFDGVLVHVGNNASDTEGCILVGKHSDGASIYSSRDTFLALYEVLLGDKDNLSITIE